MVPKVANKLAPITFHTLVVSKSLALTEMNNTKF